MDTEIKSCPSSVADLESQIEELERKNRELVHAIFVQQRDQKKSAKLIKQLTEFLEYEEAMTVDTRTQKKISNLLKKLGVWN